MKLIHTNYWFLLLILGVLGCSKSSDEPAPNTNTGVPANAQLSNASEATDSQGNQYSVGFDQASGNNQNPFVIKKDNQGNQVWKVTHENTGVDGRGVLLAIDSNDNPWVVFTVDGGSNDGGYITKKQVDANAFSGVFMNSYGRGGGPKASVIALLDPANGNIKKGTFMAARLTNGNTNTLNITQIGFNDGNIAFEISSAAWPPGTGTSYDRFPNITDADRVDGAFKIYYEIKTDLSEIVVANLLK